MAGLSVRSVTTASIERHVPSDDRTRNATGSPVPSSGSIAHEALDVVDGVVGVEQLA